MLWWRLWQLKASDPQVRVRAARELGEERQKRGVPGLIGLLLDAEAQVRIAAAQSLGKISHPASAQPLAGALGSVRERWKAGGESGGAQASEYQALAMALGSIGKEAVAPLLALLASENPDVRRWACEGLGPIGDPRVVPALSERLNDARSGVRRAAALALGRLQDKQAIAPLIKALAHRDPETALGAVEALGNLRAAEAQEPLARIAAEGGESLQIAAIAALARIGGIRAGEVLREAMESSRKKVREYAGAALSSMQFAPADAAGRAAVAVIRGDFEAALHEGEAALDPIARALHSRDEARRRKAVEVLGSIGGDVAAARLVHSLRDADAGVQQAASAALAGMGEKGVDALIGTLDSTDATVRRRAAETLANIGDPRALGALIGSVRANLRCDYEEQAEAVRAAAAAIIRILDQHPAAASESERETLSGIFDCVLADSATGRTSVAVDLSPLRALFR